MGEKINFCHHSFFYLLFFLYFKNEICLKKPSKLRFVCHFLSVDLILRLGLAEIRKIVTWTMLQTVLAQQYVEFDCFRRIWRWIYYARMCFDQFFALRQCGGLQIGQNGAKIGSRRGPKHKITYYEAKWDFKVPKMHSWVVKLVFYLNKLARSIFSIPVSLQGPYSGLKRDLKEVP